MAIERSFIFTKPWDSVAQKECEVINALEFYLSMTGGFNRIREPYRIMSKPPEDFWREFYSHVGELKIFEPMIEDFERLDKPPLIVFYSGESIATRIIQKLGPTLHAQNIGRDTLRGIYGLIGPDWRNVAHAPKPEEFEKQRKLLWKYRLA
jgi:hypothetical protein